jgi:hypothetical protein
MYCNIHQKFSSVCAIAKLWGVSWYQLISICIITMCTYIVHTYVSTCARTHTHILTNTHIEVHSLGPEFVRWQQTNWVFWIYWTTFLKWVPRLHVSALITYHHQTFPSEMYKRKLYKCIMWCFFNSFNHIIGIKPKLFFAA